jgi:hypothetical protein
LTMWTIYLEPTGFFSVRAFDIVRGLTEPVPRARSDIRHSLELARMLVPLGLHRLPRDPSDPPEIVETWM